MLCVLFRVWLLSFITNFEIYPNGCRWFILMSFSVPLCEYITICSLTLLLRGMWVVDILGYYKKCCYEHCTCIFIKIWMHFCWVYS